MDMDAKMLIF